ncbi:MAG: DUF3095 family protein [Flavisolibacter sp.]
MLYSLRMSSIHFYKNLPSLNLSVSEVFRNDHFCNVPGDWFVVISDIKNSTIAVNEGRHNDVNLVAAGSLIVALNLARDWGIEIPFFFGGDGGTVIVPQELLDEVVMALMLHNLNSRKNFNLELHIGSLCVNEIREAGNSIQICKLQYGPGFGKPIIIGNGLRFAEQKIKQLKREEKTEVVQVNLNLKGLECKWDKIKPPVDSNEIVCYLIEAIDAQSQMEMYREIILKIDEIYGSIEKRNPLSLSRLKLLLSFQKIRKEMIVKYGKWKTKYFTAAFFRTLFGKLFFRFNKTGKEYLGQLISNADTLIIDGRISTIISGKKEKRIEFIEYLNEQENAGRLFYGHHISKESIMTCYIENRNEKHMHFVDGSDGGYTEASKEFKRKLQLKSHPA